MNFSDLTTQCARFQFLHGVKTTQIRMGLKSFEEYQQMTNHLGSKSIFNGLDVICDPALPSCFIGFLCHVEETLPDKRPETYGVLCHREQDEAWFEWANQFYSDFDTETSLSINRGMIKLENSNTQYVRITNTPLLKQGFTFDALYVIGVWKAEDLIPVLVEANRRVKH